MVCALDQSPPHASVDAIEAGNAAVPAKSGTVVEKTEADLRAALHAISLGVNPLIANIHKRDFTKRDVSNMLETWRNGMDENLPKSLSQEILIHINTMRQLIDALCTEWINLSALSDKIVIRERLPALQSKAQQGIEVLDRIAGKPEKK